MNEPPTIVVVDDERDIIDLLAIALDDYSIFCTTEPAQALEYVDHHCIALLLTDVAMPGMNGIALAKHVQTKCPTVKVLLMTGYTNEVFFYPVIRKPFRLEHLLNEIETMLNASN